MTRRIVFLNLIMQFPPAIIRPRLPSILALSVLLCWSVAACAQQNPPSRTDAEILRGIDEAVLNRANAIARYDVVEHYSIFRSGEATPSAQETVHTAYNRNTGKQYMPITQSGSSLLRRTVMERVLAGEKEINLPANREGSWFTSRNYEMKPESGTVERNGHPCILVDIHARRQSPHLFNGKLWIDAADFTIVRMEGAPVQSPSIFAGESSVSRDYVKVDGFAMATHTEAHSHSFLFGDTLITIEYTDYKIVREPTANAPNP